VAIRGNEWVAGIAQGLNFVNVSVADVRVEHEVKLTDFTKWLDMRDGASEPGRVRRRTRLFPPGDQCRRERQPDWAETAHPESFSGEIVPFLASKGEDCEELNLDLVVSWRFAVAFLAWSNRHSFF
jgi:hypothetical protein